MVEKIYNPHCPKWKRCDERIKKDCMGCKDNQRASIISFNKLVQKIYATNGKVLDAVLKKWLPVK